MIHKDGLRNLKEAEIGEYATKNEAGKAVAEAAKKGGPRDT
jgi:20S proteasome subunit alpha 4